MKKLATPRRLLLQRTTIALLAPELLGDVAGGLSAPGVGESESCGQMRCHPPVPQKLAF